MCTRSRHPTLPHSPAQEFKLKLTGFDASSKIKVIKAVREVAEPKLSLKEAKAAVEETPTVLREGISREEADEFIAKLKEVGGEAEAA